jgi:hypothetical protein
MRPITVEIEEETKIGWSHIRVVRVRNLIIACERFFGRKILSLSSEGQ